MKKSKDALVYVSESRFPASLVQLHHLKSDKTKDREKKENLLVAFEKLNRKGIFILQLVWYEKDLKKIKQINKCYKKT